MTAARPAESLAYNPALDGLRAVAVYLVVAFHAGSDRFVGGYVGVDVFFVLSGYLVTQLLLRDIAAGGSISLRRFYARRFRRLLPAAFVMLVVTALVFSAVASPVEVADAEGGFQASFLYYANWYFIAQATDYFGTDVASNPVLHFWSLAVEEQFYLLWPLLLGGLVVAACRAGARQRHVLRLIVLAGAVASLAWAWSLKSSDPSRAYYGTDARAYQLLAGALIALSPGLARRLRTRAWLAGAAALAGLVSLVGVASSWVSLGAIERGVVVTGTTVVLITAEEAANGGVAGRALSLRPVVYLGRISYGTYLWHWPVLVVMAISFDVSPLTTAALAVLIATALASLSYEVLEHPIRISSTLDRHRVPVIAVGLAVSALSALVIIPRITARASTHTAATAQDASGLTPVPQLDWNRVHDDYPEITSCYGKPASACTLVVGTGPHLLLVGDSHAGMLIPAFTVIAPAEGLTLSVSVQPSCPWQRDLRHSAAEDCPRVKDDTYDRVLPALDPDVVIVMNLGDGNFPGFVKYRNADGRVLDFGSKAYDEWLERTTVASLADLTADDRDVVIVEPIPWDRLDPVECLSQAAVVEACRTVVSAQPSELELLYRTLDQDDEHVWSVDLDALVCPYLPICDPILNHQVVRIDQSHLTASFARTLAPALTQYLGRNGVLPG